MKGNFVLVQLSNPEHIVCLQGISDDRNDFLYKDSDGSQELKPFPIERFTETHFRSLDRQTERTDPANQAFRFASTERSNWITVKNLLTDAHNECCRRSKIYGKINFKRDKRLAHTPDRYMYDKGYVLEFVKKKSIENVVKSHGEDVEIVKDFQAKYKHEISVKQGDKVKVRPSNT